MPTPTLNLPLLTATQAGKEVTVNQALMLIDAAFAALGQTGNTSTLTAEQLAELFLSEAQLSAMLDAKLAALGSPVTAAQLTAALAALPTSQGGGITLAQLQAELAALPTSQGGLTLAELQAELAALPANQGGSISLAQLQTELDARPVPATVADVQAAVAGISTGGEGGGGGITLAQLQAEIAKLAPAAFSSTYTKLGVLNNPTTAAVLGAYPSVVYSVLTGKFYAMDNSRGFFEYDLATQTLTQLQSPLSPAGFKTIAPSLSVLPSGNILWAGATQNSSTATKICYIFNPTTGLWGLSFSSAYATIGHNSFKAIGNSYVVLFGAVAGALAAQAYSEGQTAFVALDNYGFPSSYIVDGVTYAGSSNSKGCALPSGKGLAIIPTTSAVNSASTALKITTVEDGGFLTTTAEPTNMRFPSNSLCMAITKTTYGAVALVKSIGTGLSRFYKYVEASDNWVAMAEGLDCTAVAMAAGLDDQVLVITESGTKPGLYLLNAAA